MRSGIASKKWTRTANGCSVYEQGTSTVELGMEIDERSGLEFHRMSVWVVAPSIRPGGGTLPKWKAAGYRVAVCRQGEPFPEADLTVPRATYGGWAPSINFLAKFVMNIDVLAEWIVGGADDILPDPKRTPEQIDSECSQHFGGTFGVMQPTGDDWTDARGKVIERYAGSPWLGREWCRRAYQGNGPMWPY